MQSATLSGAQVPRHRILGNYARPRVFLQTLHIPSEDLPVRPFLYVKNHKAGCTTILFTLLSYLNALRDGNAPVSSTMRAIHSPPSHLLRAGAKGLTLESAFDAIADPARFRFTTIRSPLRRLVSAWADKIRGGLVQKQFLMDYLGRSTDDDLSLPEFLDIVTQDEGARDLDQHWRPQVKEISHGLIEYDAVIDVSRMASDLPKVIDTIFGGESGIKDTRKAMDHRTNSAELIASLSSGQIAAIERAYENDAALYETVRVNGMWNAG